MVQVPEKQLSVALAKSHTTPQPPQFDSELATLTSQPLSALPSQLAQPELQAI